MRLALQSDMCGVTLTEIIALNRRLGIDGLDLKTAIDDQPVDRLDPATAALVRDQVTRAGMGVYCLSTGFFQDALTEPAALAVSAGKAERFLGVAAVIKPAHVRVMAPKHGGAADWRTEPGLVRWRAAVLSLAGGLAEHGTTVLIENGPDDSVLDSPAAAEPLLGELVDAQVRIIWDVQNMWQCGHFPDPGDFARFGPYVSYLHVKGGRSTADRPQELDAASRLRDADWPVHEVLAAAAETPGVAAVGLNPPHGRLPAGEDLTAIRDDDLDFLLGLPQLFDLVTSDGE